MTSGVRTTCPYCGVGCGVVAKADGAGGASVAGDVAHPANFGRLCLKGSTLGETLGLEGRLLQPQVLGRPASWERATGFVAEGLQRVIDRHGPGAVALYLSGQLLTEDYYLANKFAKGFLGTGHVDTNSRLCMASSVAGHRRAFGSDTVPNTYEDLDSADLLVLVGSNAAWCHPVLYQRMQKARETRGARLINIDPRRTATAEGADLHLPIAPGMDGVLFSWLLVSLVERGAVNAAYVAAHTSGLDLALAAARRIAPDLASVAERTGLPQGDIARFVDLFIATDRVVTSYSQGVNQSAQGTDKVNAILNCHLVTGRIGRPGSGPFSLTGQPNAMGGREVGGLANMLAAHMNYGAAEVERVARFWQAPRMATSEGHKAVAMFEAIERGEIRALWVMHTNPAVTLPRADAVRAALKRLDLFVVSEALARTDTTAAGAHVLLPAAAWGEKDGTVTNSERRISRQRAFLPPPGEAKPDWQHIALVARRMGFSGFDHASAAAVFREHAALSAFENDGARSFDIGGAADLSDADYDALQPFHWPWRAGGQPQPRLFAEGGFHHADGRARLVAIAPPALAARTDTARPFVLNTGRVRDHWHTMTRTGKARGLAQHMPEPLLQLHPDDARAAALAEGGYAQLDSDHGRVTLRVALDASVPRGSVFAPMHWNDATAALARIDALVHAVTDPVSGQPESKATPVSLRPLAMRSQGFLLSRGRVALPGWLQHARLTIAGGEALLFASTRRPEALHALLKNHLGSGFAYAEAVDATSGDYRTLAFEPGQPDADGGLLAAALFVGPERDMVALDGLVEAFARPRLDAEQCKAALAGRPACGGAPKGRLICSCFGVRHEAILAAVRGGATHVDAVGELLKAGTNCGSCKPEIRRVIADEHTTPAATAAA
jgi:assimilatory nitrate reductase catalytic subunit